MITITNIAAITVAAILPLYMTSQRKKVFLPLSLVISITMVTLLETTVLLSLSNQDHLYLLEMFSLTNQTILAILLPTQLWIANYVWQKEQLSISIPWKQLITSSPLFAIFTFMLPNRSFAYSPNSATGKISFLGNNGFIFYLLLMVYLFAAMIQQEQNQTGKTWTTCRKIKFGILGTGIISAILIINFCNYFSQGLILALLLATAIWLFVLLLPENVQSRYISLIHQKFLKKKHNYRNQWIQFTDNLSGADSNEALGDAIIAGFCDTFEMRVGALFLINETKDNYIRKAAIGMKPDTISFNINDPYVRSLHENKQVIDLHSSITAIENNSQSSFFKETAACFIIPLSLNETVDGFILLGSPRSQIERYAHEDSDIMRTMAKQSSSALLNLHLAKQLSATTELAAIGKISAFVIHDLKNLISSVSLMFENAQKYISEPAFQSDMLVSLEGIVTRMNALIQQLKQQPEKDSLQVTHFDLLEMARETAALVNETVLDVTGEHIIAEGDREELLKVTLNLMLNAVEATEGNTKIKVEVGENGSPFIRVKDKGCGIPTAFMQNVLFKPFSTTKKEGLGIGLYQSKQIIEAHGGRIDVVSTINQGSEFTVWLPKMQAGTA